MKTSRLLHAFHGLMDSLRTDLSIRLQFIIALLVIIVAVLVCVPLAGWVLLTLSIGLVITAEIGNSALEHLADQVYPKRSPRIRRAKDLAAAAVLVAAIVAVVVGAFVFLPPLLSGTIGTCIVSLF